MLKLVNPNLLPEAAYRLAPIQGRAAYVALVFSAKNRRNRARAEAAKAAYERANRAAGFGGLL